MELLCFLELITKTFGLFESGFIVECCSCSMLFSKEMSNVKDFVFPRDLDLSQGGKASETALRSSLDGKTLHRCSFKWISSSSR